MTHKRKENSICLPFKERIVKLSSSCKVPKVVYTHWITVMTKSDQKS